MPKKATKKTVKPAKRSFGTIRLMRSGNYQASYPDPLGRRTAKGHLLQHHAPSTFVDYEHAATIRSEAEQHAAERQADLDDTEAALETMARSLESRKANVADREAKAKADALAAAEDRQKAADARARDEQKEREHQQARDAELARLRALPSDMDWWLYRPLKGGGTRRYVFLRDAAKRQQAFARFEAKANALSEEAVHDDDQLGR
ncbi:hypothetical protein HMPREF3223_01125 [Cutibacterium avidum]|nr:hypothetical protein HMPREF3223_01125 [Cutibacterium avidum]OIJ75789.1 hypothetical protein APY06_03430 [Cutibacterium avidum]